jgi:hypothetical protein
MAAPAEPPPTTITSYMASNLTASKAACIEQDHAS